MVGGIIKEKCLSGMVLILDNFKKQFYFEIIEIEVVL